MLALNSASGDAGIAADYMLLCVRFFCREVDAAVQTQHEMPGRSLKDGAVLLWLQGVPGMCNLSTVNLVFVRIICTCHPLYCACPSCAGIALTDMMISKNCTAADVQQQPLPKEQPGLSRHAHNVSSCNLQTTTFVAYRALAQLPAAVRAKGKVSRQHQPRYWKPWCFT